MSKQAKQLFDFFLFIFGGFTQVDALSGSKLEKKGKLLRRRLQGSIREYQRYNFKEYQIRIENYSLVALNATKKQYELESSKERIH